MLRNLTSIKWVGTALCVVGMGLTAFNIYPINLLFAGLGSAIWMWVGDKQGDEALFAVEFVAVSLAMCGLIYWLHYIARF